MCGEESISRIRDSWTKIVPTLLQMDGEVPTDSEETRSYKALLFIDTQLRPAGVASKAAAAFTLYQVSKNNNVYIRIIIAGNQIFCLPKITGYIYGGSNTVIPFMRHYCGSMHLKFNSYLLQVGTDIEEVTAEKTFPEPRLAIFADKSMNGMQAFILGEGKVLFEVLGDSVIDSVISLFATYYAFYVSYPKPSPASGLLLFIQEVLMGVKETSVKKTVRYTHHS